MGKKSKEDERAPYTKDISIIMTAFVMKMIGLWLASNKKEQRRRNLSLIYTIIAIMFGMWVQINEFYHSWPNFSHCLYTTCNIISLILIVLKLSLLYIYRREFCDLLLYTYKNFWHSNYDSNEKLMLSNCERICTLCIAGINFCAQSTVVSYVVTPIVSNIRGNNSERLLPFNMWLDNPVLSTSPYYEMLFTSQVLALNHAAMCYVSFDNVLCLMSLHTTTQLRILHYRLANLGKCYAMFKSCVRQHQAYIQYCRRLEGIFTLIVLGHVLIYNLLICLLGYQIFLTDHGASMRIAFTFHMLASLSGLLLFTYSCDGLIEESTNLGTAVYSGPWINLPMNRIGRRLRRDLRIVIIRSRKPCCLTAGGFFPISLETFTTVLSTAMSYFTLLRQSMNS